MISVEQVSLLIEALRLAGKAKSWFEKIKIYSLLTYKTAIDYFLEERPKYPKNSVGVILRQKSSDGLKIYQVFLDSNDELICYPEGRPYGRLLLAEQLDQELEEAFGDKDMVLIT